MAKIKESTLRYALDVLDAHRKHANAHPEDARQEGYYLGLRDMLNVSISNAFSELNAVGMDSDGRHYILTKDGRKIRN